MIALVKPVYVTQYYNDLIKIEKYNIQIDLNANWTLFFFILVKSQNIK